jgi:hypothetical protein
VNFVRSFKTICKNNKKFIIGLIIGILIILPFTFRSSYERLNAEVYITTDNTKYADFYQYYFDDLVVQPLPAGSYLLLCWFNVTQTECILLDIQFNDAVTILRLGVYQYVGEKLLIDKENIIERTILQIDTESIGLYSCAIFYQAATEHFIDVEILYLI